MFSLQSLAIRRLPYLSQFDFSRKSWDVGVQQLPIQSGSRQNMIRTEIDHKHGDTLRTNHFQHFSSVPKPQSSLPHKNKQNDTLPISVRVFNGTQMSWLPRVRYPFGRFTFKELFHVLFHIFVALVHAFIM